MIIFPVLNAVAGAGWRDQPGRIALSVLGIAFGVALGVAVHLINASAASDFNVALRTLAGEADLIIRGSRSGFPDVLYPVVARLPGLRVTSPAVEVDAQLAGRREVIKVIGLDPFRALQVQRHLVPDNREAILELLKPDTVVLSRAAADDLRLKTGDILRLQAGTGLATLRVIDVLPGSATRQRVAIMDIASAQWRFGRLGEIHRIDIKLQPGTDPASVRKSLERMLPAGVLVSTPEAEAERGASVSRAYRLNLDMLALVALFTGAFLVFSSQFLALLRRRTQLALLRAIGLTRWALVRLLMTESMLAGMLGSALGIALGCVFAQYGIKRFGGDLGAGYFRSVAPELHVVPGTLFIFFALGILFAMLGAALPALEAARREPARALRAGDEEEALRRIRTLWPALLLIAVGLVLSQAPPISGLPVAGYLSVALILTGAIAAMPRLSEAALSRLPVLRHAPAALATAQLQATPRQVGVSLAAILASFSLMVAMVIMVGSFRVSLQTWLDRMLSADLYVRAGRLGETGFFTREEQSRLMGLAGVSQIVFVRSQTVLMRADRSPVVLLARPVIAGRASEALPLEGREITPRTGEAPPAWLSEVAADLLGVKQGDRIDVPIAGRLQAFTVAGIWRDYARQNGAIVIDRALYSSMTGDDRANEAAIYLRADATFDVVAREARAVLGGAEGVELAPAHELKAISLSIFDRTFAVTYALEGAAVLIGLFGVSAGFSAQALARRREFGVLRHVGMTRGQIAAMLGCEGLVVGTLGVTAGLAVGWLLSLILIHVINRQSFHWSMNMHLPWLTLGLLAGALIVTASLTAITSGRRAMTDDVTRAVREDW